MIFVFCIYIPEGRTLSCCIDLKLIMDVLGVTVVVGVVIVVAVVDVADGVVIVAVVDVADGVVDVAVAVAAVVVVIVVVGVGDVTVTVTSVTVKNISDSSSKYKLMICSTTLVPVIYILFRLCARVIVVSLMITLEKKIFFE